MPDFLTAPLRGTPALAPVDVLVRLLIAFALGAVIAGIYRRTRGLGDASTSFQTTLVLLAILIAMVTRVIGDNVARAFSLVGALSIVRFRTVVRDTQDTAYVIFAVAIGMAVGANDLWVAAVGIIVVGLAAYLMRPRRTSIGTSNGDLPFALHVRVGLGHDLQTVLTPILDRHLGSWMLTGVSTARQGMMLELTYDATMKPGQAPDALVSDLNRVEGVQSVSLQRADSIEVQA